MHGGVMRRDVIHSGYIVGGSAGSSVHPLPSRSSRRRTSYRSFVRDGAHVTVGHCCRHALRDTGCAFAQTDATAESRRLVSGMVGNWPHTYLLKELFRHFWEYRRGGWAKRYLKKWFWWATHSRLEPMRDFAWMLRRHEQGILNYFRVPIDNGTVEGLNNKAKLVIHKAYGFRTANNYIRNLYHCLGNLPLPQTVHTFV